MRKHQFDYLYSISFHFISMSPHSKMYGIFNNKYQKMLFFKNNICVLWTAFYFLNTFLHIPIFQLIPSYTMFWLLNIYISKLLLSLCRKEQSFSPCCSFLSETHFQEGGEEGGISCRGGGGKCSVNILSPSPCLLYLCCSILWCM